MQSIYNFLCTLKGTNSNIEFNLNDVECDKYLGYQSIHIKSLNIELNLNDIEDITDNQDIRMPNCIKASLYTKKRKIKNIKKNIYKRNNNTKNNIIKSNVS